MPVLQEAQDVYGYLPIEVQKIIAAGMDVSLEDGYYITARLEKLRIYSHIW